MATAAPAAVVPSSIVVWEACFRCSDCDSQVSASFDKRYFQDVVDSAQLYFQDPSADEVTSSCDPAPCCGKAMELDFVYAKTVFAAFQDDPDFQDAKTVAADVHDARGGGGTVDTIVSWELVFCCDACNTTCERVLDTHHSGAVQLDTMEQPSEADIFATHSVACCGDKVMDLISVLPKTVFEKEASEDAGSPVSSSGQSAATLTFGLSPPRVDDGEDTVDWSLLETDEVHLPIVERAQANERTIDATLAEYVDAIQEEGLDAPDHPPNHATLAAYVAGIQEEGLDDGLVSTQSESCGGQNSQTVVSGPPCVDWSGHQGVNWSCLDTE